MGQLLRYIEERSKRILSKEEVKAVPSGGTKIDKMLPVENSSTTSTPSPGLATADIALLVALDEPEGVMLRKAFMAPWKIEVRENVAYRVGTCQFDDVEARVVVAAQTDMGMVPAAILATKTINAWRPAFIGMSGICAGVRSRVNLGDIVVAKQLFDYGSGKIQEGKLVPDYSPIPLESDLCSRVTAYAADFTLMRGIRDSWPTNTGKPDTELRAHVGAFGSGAAVVADDQVIEEVKQHKRSLTAIDMEAYAVARSATDATGGAIPCLIVKGVQDFADQYKADQFREYAAFVSAAFMYRFVASNIKDILAKKGLNRTAV